MSKKRKPDQKPEETESFEEKFMKMSMKFYEMQHPVLSPEGVMEESITRSIAEKNVPRTIRQTSPSVSTVSINAVPEDPDEDYEAYMEQQKTLNELSNKYREEKKLTQGDQVRSILQSIVTERKPEAEQDLTGKFIDFAIIERGTVYIWMKKSIDPDLKQPLPDPVKISVSAIGNRLYNFAHENAPFFLNPDGTVDGLLMINQFNAEEQAKEEKRNTLLYPNTENYIMPNTKVGNMILSGQMPLNDVQDIEITNTDTSIITTVLLNIDDKDGIMKQLGEGLDEVVHNAICAIDFATRKQNPSALYPFSFSLKNIAKVTYRCEDPTPNQMATVLAILKALAPYRSSLVYHPKHNPKIKKETLDDYLVNIAIKTAINHDDTEIVTVELRAKPLLLEYAERTGQVIYTSFDNLKIKETRETKSRNAQALKINGKLWVRDETPISMAGMRPAIVEYLIKRIHSMYNNRTIYKPILRTDTLYSKSGSDKNRDQKNKLRKFVEKTLRSFCFDGIIKDYSIETDPKTKAVTAYKLVLFDDSPFKKDKSVPELPENNLTDSN